MADQTIAVQQLYVAYFSRPADVAGLAYWSNVLNTNAAGIQQASAAFAASAEYKAAYSQNTNEQIVATVYTHLFGRTAEAAGVNFWADALNRHLITIDNVVTQIAAGAQGTDKFAYEAKTGVSVAFTQHLDQPFEATAYATGPHANQIAIDFIATVKDQLSAANASNPATIDGVVSQIVADAGTYGSAPPVQLVGNAPAYTFDGNMA